MIHFKSLLKVISLTALASMPIFMTGCTNWFAEADRKNKEKLVIKSMTTPTSPIVTAFEKVCLNNENSPADMIKAAKTYNVGEIKTTPYKSKNLISPFKYETSTGTRTAIKTLDNKMRFIIYEPRLECEVETLSGRNAVVDALLSSPQYTDNEKIMDIQLGMILLKKYGSAIKVSQMGKAHTSNIYYNGPMYSRFNGTKEVRYLLTPGSNSISIKLTDEKI